MNAKKKEQKRIQRGLLNAFEHSEKRRQNNLKNWAKNPKNKGKKPFINT